MNIKNNQLYSPWHIALEPDSDYMLQDVIVPLIAFDEVSISKLLNTKQLKVDTVKGNENAYLIMYDGEGSHPYREIMIWKCQSRNDELNICNMELKDSAIIKYAWQNYLLPKDSNAKYIPPRDFLFMVEKG